MISLSCYISILSVKNYTFVERDGGIDSLIGLVRVEKLEFFAILHRGADNDGRAAKGGGKSSRVIVDRLGTIDGGPVEIHRFSSER